MDYLLLTYLTSERTMLSFGVGEWSGIFPVRQLMRSAGGYFIRRDFKRLIVSTGAGALCTDGDRSQGAARHFP